MIKRRFLATNLVTNLKKIKAFCKKIATPGHGCGSAINKITLMRIKCVNSNSNKVMKTVKRNCVVINVKTSLEKLQYL